MTTSLKLVERLIYMLSPKSLDWSLLVSCYGALEIVGIIISILIGACTEYGFILFGQIRIFVVLDSCNGVSLV